MIELKIIKDAGSPLKGSVSLLSSFEGAEISLKRCQVYKDGARSLKVLSGL